MRKFLTRSALVLAALGLANIVTVTETEAASCAREPGQKYTVKTFATHPWVFTDGPGNCIEMWVAQGRVEIRHHREVDR
jgi:hypothetical protein